MVTFRIDDIGASSKYYNQHGEKTFFWKGIPFFYFPLANFWFFKRMRPFKKWGHYEELTVHEWQEILAVFKENNIVPIIAITAAWVDAHNTLIPFPEKFPQQAALLKEAFLKNEIIIANHGLTHCIVGRHLPRFFGSNRKFHREFWPKLEQSVHTEHIQKSQVILEGYFEKMIEIFVPPGNVWSKKTYQALRETHIKTIIANHYLLDSDEPLQDIEFKDDTYIFFNFHDRELKLYGKEWLKEKINSYS